MSVVWCTLFEGGYDIGAAALINSLHRAGFTGRLVCGVRGSLPGWATHVASLHPMAVTFVPLDCEEHLTYFKPRFMLDVLATDPTASHIAYVDPDVVLKAPAPYIEAWIVQGGVTGVVDVNGNVPPHHPLRVQWRAFLHEVGMSVQSPRSVYLNAGFLGLSREHKDLLEAWADLTSLAQRVLGQLNSLKNGNPSDLFHSADQDALNMALEVVTHDLHWVGPEGMDFASGGYLLSHAIGRPKPWEGHALTRSLRGRPPSHAAREVLGAMDGPLRPVPKRRLAALRMDQKAGALVSRAWRRS